MPAFVQDLGTASGANAANNSGAISVTVPVGGCPRGDLVAIWVSSGWGAGSLTVTDTRGNSYAIAASHIGSAGGITGYVYISVLSTALTSGNTISISWPSFFVGGVTTAMSVVQFTGVTATTDGTSTSASASSGNITTTNANDLLLGMVSISPGSLATITQPGSFNAITTKFDNTGSSPVQIGGGYQLPGATGTYSYAPTLSSSTDAATAIIGLVPVNLAPPIRSYTYQQAVRRASVWMKRKSRIAVPVLWTPADTCPV